VGQAVQVELEVELAGLGDHQVAQGSLAHHSHGAGVEQLAQAVGGDHVGLDAAAAAARLTAASTSASSRASTQALRVARPPRLASRPATNSSTTVATCSAESIRRVSYGVVKNQV
jgi:hypothetical protein